MLTTYEQDIVAWANQQAALLRAGRFDALDIQHLADEIEDVGKSEQRELTNRLVVLIGHLLKWRYQPARRGSSWRRTIAAQRKDVAYALKQAPSLKHKFDDMEWWDLVWTKAAAMAESETGLEDFPEVCPWSFSEIMDPDFWPE